MSDKVNRRDQVKELIEKGTMTKQQIAAAIDVSPASVSSQMTYLRWMGHFIKYDDNKILSFCTEDEYNAWQEDLTAKRKTTSANARTPEEQAKATHTTIKRQESQLTNWQTKKEAIEKDLAEEPEDEELLELLAEADANIVLLTIKLKRNKAKAEELPEYIPEEESSDDDDDTGTTDDASEDDDDAAETGEEEDLM